MGRDIGTGHRNWEKRFQNELKHLVDSYIYTLEQKPSEQLDTCGAQPGTSTGVAMKIRLV